MRMRLLPLVLVPALVAGLAAATRTSHAEDAVADKAEVTERCALRLSIALTGKSPTAEALAAPDPQAAVDKLLATPEFADL